MSFTILLRIEIFNYSHLKRVHLIKLTFLIGLMADDDFSIISKIKKNLAEMDSNLSSMMDEKDMQIKSMKNILDIMNNFLDESTSDGQENNKLRVRHKRGLYQK